jgi:hypothetical protein
MFAGVEILNENNHGSKGQAEANLSLPEIQVSGQALSDCSPWTDTKYICCVQMSLIYNEEEIVRDASGGVISIKKMLSPKVSEKLIA